MPTSNRILPALAAAAALALGGCRATHAREGPRAPTVIASLAHYAGSPLAGAAAAESVAIGEDPAQSYVLHARLYALAHPAGALHAEESAAPAAGPDSAGFEPLSAHVRLVAAFRGDEPIRPSADVGLAAQLCSGASASGWVAALERAPSWERTFVTELDGALPEGVSIALSLRSQEALEVPGEGPVRAHVALEIARTGEGLRAAVLREELAAQERGASLPSAAEPRVLRREFGALDVAPELDGAPLVFELLRPPEDERAAPLVWVVQLQRAPADAAARERHAAAHQRALAEIASSARTTRARRARVEQQEAHGREIETAFATLRERRDPRAALVFLCSATGAELAGDLALIADAPTLERYVKEVVDSVPDAAAAARDGATLGFVLETRAWAFLVRDSDEHPLAPEFVGLCVRHGGELARSSGAVEDVLASVHTLPALAARVREENRNALEDASPAVRVRAFDWLAARALAPAGYDPLASLAERRQALAAADAAPHPAAEGSK